MVIKVCHSGNIQKIIQGLESVGKYLSLSPCDDVIRPGFAQTVVRVTRDAGFWPKVGQRFGGEEKC